VLRPVEVAPGLVTWPVPAREFVLYRVRLDGGSVAGPGTGPRILVCTEGEVSVHGEGADAVPVRTGTAAYAAADSGPITVAGVGEVFIAAVPE